MPAKPRHSSCFEAQFGVRTGREVGKEVVCMQNFRAFSVVVFIGYSIVESARHLSLSSDRSE